jgi:hypothetical protein
MTKTKLIECKNIDWNICSKNNLDDRLSVLKAQDKIAKDLGMIFELHSPRIPDSFKLRLDSKGIKFIEK